ncbi:MAG: HDOD domain-containing protein [Hungatella sp.]
MNSFVVRQGIKDREDNLIGYEILFQNDGDNLYNASNDAMAADTIADFLMQNNDKIFDGKVIFMTFTPSLLFRNTPKIFEPDSLVIQIEDNILVHPLANAMIQKYQKAGYHFAINDFQFAPRYFSMMEFVDYFKIDVRGKQEGAARISLSNIIRMTQGFKKKCIAVGVDTKEDYDLAIELKADYLEGTYMSDATMAKTSKVDYLQGNFFQLVVSVTKDEPDLMEVELIISRDAYLSYALLKLVNSAYFAFRKKISSIRQALVTLGITQLKQWVYLLSLKDQSDSSSEEILRMSFLRATFCSKLVKYIHDFPLSGGDAYIMGMFSTLDYMVDAPMEEILDGIPILEEIKDGILHKEGKCSQLLDLVMNYEKADWQKISMLSEDLGIPKNVIAQVYFDCVEEVNQIWKSLTSNYDRGESPEAPVQPET